MIKHGREGTFVERPEMKGFWQKTGWVAFFAIEALALLWGLAWTENIPEPLAWMLAVVVVFASAALVWIWYINLPDRCRKCGMIYNRWDYFTDSIHFTVANLNSGHKLDLTVCTKCANTSAFVGTDE